MADYSGWSSVEDFVHAAIAGARLDPWDGDWPLLIVESDSLAGLLQPLAREYRVVLVPLGGQASCGQLGAAVPKHVANGTSVLYLGDFDLSGGHIERSAKERIEAYAGVELDWRRVAITEEQVNEHGLTWIEKVDKRHDPPLKYRAVEAESGCGR